MAKTKPTTSIDESGFVITDEIKTWTESKYPGIDVDETYEKFVEVYMKTGTCWYSWLHVWRGYLSRSIKNKWDGVVFKDGQTLDPVRQELTKEGAAKGFRPPGQQESNGAYRTAMRAYDPPIAENVRSIVGAVKRFGG